MKAVETERGLQMTCDMKYNKEGMMGEQAGERTRAARLFNSLLSLLVAERISGCVPQFAGFWGSHATSYCNPARRIHQRKISTQLNKTRSCEVVVPPERRNFDRFDVRAPRCSSSI